MATPLVANVVSTSIYYYVGQTAPTVHEIPLTIPVGSNRVLYLCWMALNARGISNVQWQGATATEIENRTDASNYRFCVHRLIAPATGSANVVINTLTNDYSAQVHVVSFANVDQTTPEHPVVFAEGGGTVFGVTVEPDSLEDLGFSFNAVFDSQAMSSYYGDQTLIGNEIDYDGFSPRTRCVIRPATIGIMNISVQTATSVGYTSLGFVLNGSGAQGAGGSGTRGPHMLMLGV